MMEEICPAPSRIWRLIACLPCVIILIMMVNSTKQESQSQQFEPTLICVVQFHELIRRLPKEWAKRLLVAQWQRLLPKKPSEVGLEGVYYSLLPHH